MRLLFLNHVAIARESLKSNKVRTLLTTLGITLGVACMTTILSLSSGATKLISDQVSALGGNIAVIRPGAPQPIKSLKDLTPTGATSFTASSLTEQDFNSVQKIKDVTYAAPLMSITGSVKSQSTTLTDAPIVATTPSFQKLSNLKIDDGQGQFIDSVTNKNTVVIGDQLSIDLFGTNQSIGQTILIRGQQFTVIGILKKVDTSVNYNNIDLNDSAIISLESGKAFNQGIAQIRQINIRTDNKKDLKTTTTAANKVITSNHNGEKDFTILSGNDISKPTSQLFMAIGAATSVVAAVSLIIGGIGIMNIMLVSVAERTREIGIRKAVGASNSHITMQFLIESLVMSIIGGISGYIIGYLAAFTLSTFLPFIPVFTWQIAVIAIGISIIVGTLFGLYPAVRAARKNPIEALRQYY